MTSLRAVYNNGPTQKQSVFKGENYNRGGRNNVDYKDYIIRFCYPNHSTYLMTMTTRTFNVIY